MLQMQVEIASARPPWSKSFEQGLVKARTYAQDVVAINRVTAALSAAEIRQLDDCRRELLEFSASHPRVLGEGDAERLLKQARSLEGLEAKLGTKRAKAFSDLGSELPEE